MKPVTQFTATFDPYCKAWVIGPKYGTIVNIAVFATITHRKAKTQRILAQHFISQESARVFAGQHKANVLLIRR